VRELPDLEEIVSALQAGQAVVIPTDTVYGLAARAADPAATARLFELKGRASGVPVAVLCADVEQALALAEIADDPGVRAVAERWWPGPLTLVVRRRDGLDWHLGAPEHTIGLRVPDHDLVRALAVRVGPLATTSANRHGEPPAVTASEAADALGAGVALVVDGGPLGGQPSTVLDATVRPWAVLRAGAADVSGIVDTANAGRGPAG